MNIPAKGRSATRLLFDDDPYLQQAPARVIGHTDEGAILVDQSIFHPAGGGQPGDSGWLSWLDGRLPVATALMAPGGVVALIPAEPLTLPAPGVEVAQSLDWARRHRHMRLHTALHLLSALIAQPAAESQISGSRVWAGYVLPFPAGSAPVPDAASLERRLNLLIARDLPVVVHRAPVAALRGVPAFDVMGGSDIAPGDGTLRLIAIGEGDETVNLQPCEGTHVARTAEIGAVAVARIDNRGAQLRVTISLTGGAVG